MRTIKFRVNQQRIKPMNSVSFIYPGTDNYLKLEFEFGEDWDGCTIGISFGSKKIMQVLRDNSCVVPKEDFEDSQLSFYLAGVKKDYAIKSQEFIIKLGG